MVLRVWHRLFCRSKKGDKGATQVDYILASAIFIIFFALAVQFITSYFTDVKGTADSITLRSQALSILGLTDRGYDPPNWPQIANGSNDLLLLLHFNNDTLDYSGKGNDGAPNGGVNCSASVTGKFFSACSFDGVDDYVNVGTSIGNTQAFGTEASFEAWIKVNAQSGSLDAFLNKNWGFRIGVRPGPYIEALVYNDTGGTYSDASSPSGSITLGKWHQVVYTHDISFDRIYIDGNLSVSEAASFTNDIETNANAATISLDTFNGTIDEVAVWNRSLSAGEIGGLYQQGLVRMGLMSYAYRMIVVVNNTKPYLVNTSENATATDIAGELVQFNMSSFGFANIDYNSVVVYDQNNAVVPHQVSGSNVTFNASVSANSSSQFAVYFGEGSLFPESSTIVTGTNNLTEVIQPPERIQVLQYNKLRHLNETSYADIKNTAGIGSSFNIKLYDIDDNTTFMSFGGSVPRRGNIVALQRFMLFQNSTAGIRNGRLTVQTW